MFDSARRQWPGISVAQEVQSSRVPGPVESAEDSAQNTGNSVTSNPCAAQWLSKDPAIESLQHHVQLVSGLGANRFASLDHCPKLPRKKEHHPRQTHANNAIVRDTAHGEGSEESPDDHIITFHTLQAVCPTCLPNHQISRRHWKVLPRVQLV